MPEKPSLQKRYEDLIARWAWLPWGPMVAFVACLAFSILLYRLGQDVTLEYLKVLASAPPLISIVVLVSLYWFRNPIKAFIGRIVKVEGGGGSITAARQEVEPGKKAEAYAEYKKEEAIKELRAVLKSGGDREFLPRPVRELLDQPASESSAEFKWLAEFLTPESLLLLDWIGLGDHGRRNKGEVFGLRMLHGFHGRHSADFEQSGILEMILAFTTYGLVKTSEHKIFVTQKGLDFLKYVNPL